MNVIDRSIAEDMQKAFGITVLESEEISGGWMNTKWRSVTNRGEVLVKRFSTERFPDRKLAHVERALGVQHLAFTRDVPCPEILTCGGKAIRWLENGVRYTMMVFCPGQIERPETVTLTQMKSLGEACGKMKNVFAGIPVDDNFGGGNGPPQETMANLRRHLQNLFTQGFKDTPEDYRKAVENQENVLRGLPDSFLDEFATGLAHEDFAADNLLFLPDRLSAIVDFDRCQQGFILHDVGRAILSLALNDGVLDREKIRAFTDGYNRCGDLTLKDIADALRITWCVEMPWWVTPHYFTDQREKTYRFLQEILWVGAHWEMLENLLGV